MINQELLQKRIRSKQIQLRRISQELSLLQHDLVTNYDKRIPVKLDQDELSIIFDTVCAWKKVNRDIVESTLRCRNRTYVEVRQLVMHFCMTLLDGVRDTDAGNVFGQDRCTALHADKTVNNLIQTSREYLDEYVRIKADIIKKLQSYRDVCNMISNDGYSGVNETAADSSFPDYRLYDKLWCRARVISGFYEGSRYYNVGLITDIRRTIAMIHYPNLMILQ